MPKHRRRVDASVGASGPRDFAVRLMCHSSKAPRRPPHPAPTFVTIAKRPFWWRGTARLMPLICPAAKAEYFFAQGWTGSITLIGLDKSAVWRNGLERRL